MHHAHRVFALRDFSEAEPAKANFIQSGEEFAEGIVLQVQVPHVDGEDFLFDQIEVRIPTVAGDVLGV